MKRSFILVCLGLAALFCTLNLATSISFEHSIVAFSSDKEYKFEFVPPRFTNQISYGFFQAGNFLHLTLSEGADVAKSAAVTGYLYQKQKDDYVLIWCRPLASTIIPSRAFVLGVKTDILVIVDGQRSEVPVSSNYFGFYDFQGASLTNGFYRRSKRDTWSLKGKNVELRDEQNRFLEISTLMKPSRRSQTTHFMPDRHPDRYPSKKSPPASSMNNGKSSKS